MWLNLLILLKCIQMTKYEIEISSVSEQHPDFFSPYVCYLSYSPHSFLSVSLFSTLLLNSVLSGWAAFMSWVIKRRGMKGREGRTGGGQTGTEKEKKKNKLKREMRNRLNSKQCLVLALLHQIGNYPTFFYAIKCLCLKVHVWVETLRLVCERDDRT